MKYDIIGICMDIIGLGSNDDKDDKVSIATSTTDRVPFPSTYCAQLWWYSSNFWQYFLPSRKHK